ncbi:MAG: DUF5659 domain-containing protein [Melioribacteraceae bacterium]|jgi:hypothetical protein|nr:DUF5659 domain-containing protein [Melioribacteraceae bacterium]
MKKILNIYKKNLQLILNGGIINYKLKAIRNYIMQKYSTEDVYLAAYLLNEGIPLAGTKLNSPKVTQFLFEVSDKLKEKADNFYSHHAKVEAQEFIASLRSIKTLIHEMKSDYKRQPKELNKCFQNKTRVTSMMK